MNKKRSKLFLTTLILSLFLISFFSIGFGLAQNDPTGKCTVNGDTFYTVRSRCDGTFITASGSNTGTNVETISAITNVWQSAINILEPIFATVLGSSVVDGKTAGEVLFMKVLFFLIILAIIWTVLNMIDFFSDNTWVVVVIAGSVSILATRFLATPGWLSTVLLPYTVLGIALTAFLPFLIYFYFVEKALGTHQTMRKIAWILAAVVFTALYISRFEEIGNLAGAESFNPAYIYLITAVTCIAFFIFDGTIRRAFVTSEMKSLGAADRSVLITELRRKIRQANDDLTNGILSPKDHKKMIKEFKKRLINAESF